ncbi:PEPxxWA-CTERM sorting domain-containing protein [Sphingomonas sp. ID0503]|uniref:PEPxxWA-CTERM sorting domain-containing protein n=1 Tax=Sphingomonas sp. ID0503 TaxID=3399691 RepID=UPI003AFB0215
MGVLVFRKMLLTSVATATLSVVPAKAAVITSADGAANNSSLGLFFDIGVGAKDVTLTSLNTYVMPGGMYDIYYRAGSFVGHNTSSDGWTSLGRVTVTSNSATTPVNFDFDDVTVDANGTYGFYIFSARFDQTGSILSYFGQGNDPSAIGQTAASNTDLTLYRGMGSAGRFQGGTSNPRAFVGSIEYTVAGPGVAAVPEPASWAMLLGGFGLTGLSLRRRKAFAPSAV